jgi:hypothetical protein
VFPASKTKRNWKNELQKKQLSTHLSLHGDSMLSNQYSKGKSDGTR